MELNHEVGTKEFNLENEQNIFDILCTVTTADADTNILFYKNYDLIGISIDMDDNSKCYYNTMLKTEVTIK